MGGFEAGSLDLVEPTLKYHPGVFEVLTLARYPGPGHRIMRWSHLHGDMQGRHEIAARRRAVHPAQRVPGKAISEIPCRVSSDLHEWRNDLNAVSTRGSVKLQSR